MITAADIQTEIEKTERGLALLRVEVNQSEVRLTALRTLLATTPPVADVQSDPEPCMEAPTVAPALDQSEGEPEALPEQAPEAAPTTPDQSEVGRIRTLFSRDPHSPDPGWRWLPHVQHLSHQESRIRVVLDGMAAVPTAIWSPVHVASEMNMSQDQASHALSDLYKHGLVVRRKVGRIHQYKYRFIVTDQPMTDAAPTAT